MSYAQPMPRWAFMTSDDRPGKRRGGRHHRQAGWGQGGPWGPPPRPRRDRGDVRLAILLLLDEQPRHGYEIITELTERSEGRWRPSPGSVYPVLKRLAKEGLVAAVKEDGKNTFSLTPAGTALVEQQREEWGRAVGAPLGPGRRAIGGTVERRQAARRRRVAGEPARRPGAGRGGRRHPRRGTQEDIRDPGAVRADRPLPAADQR